MEGRIHLGQYLEWAVKMAACKEDKMLKTSKRQNQAFKSHKKRVFMLSLHLIQYPWTHLLMQSLITWSSWAFFLFFTSGNPIPHEPRWAEQCLWPGAYFTYLYREWQSPVSFMDWMTVLLEASGFHLTSFMCISVMGPQHSPYWLLMNPVFMAPKQNIFLLLLSQSCTCSVPYMCTTILNGSAWFTFLLE